VKRGTFRMRQLPSAPASPMLAASTSRETLHGL